MKKSLLLLIVILIICSSSTSREEHDNFYFIVFGDMPYFLPQDFARFENLIHTVNKEHQSFNVHVGDIKSSSTPCSDDYYSTIRDYFNQFEKPLIYTPGDNEWTDCNKPQAGAYQPEERLSVVRKMFFKDKNSLGKSKMETRVESENKDYNKFVENRMWSINGITFGTVHLVGTNNYFLPESKDHNLEFFERDNANVNWLNEIFKEANNQNSVGVFLFTQADMFNPDKAASGCFDRFLRELKNLTTQFIKPVILIHGDSHKFIVDKPLIRDAVSKKVLENFTRIQVFGEQDMHAVKVAINQSSPSLFTVEQFLIPDN